MLSKKHLLPIEWALAALFLAASVYFHTNPGGTGFRIPANITIWLIASLIGFYSLYRFTKKPYFHLPRYYLYILAFPVLAFISGIFAGVEIPNQWLMRMLYIWGGALFLFSLFQYPLKQARIDRVLFIVVIAGLLHAAIGIAQIFLLTDMLGWLPVNSSGIPTGLFQQINNQASFQVTVLLIAFWLITRPAVRYGHCWRFIVLAIAIACSAFVVSYSGSRVGALGFILAAPLFLVSRWRFIRQDYWLWLTVLCIMLLAAISASSFENQRGLASVAEKTTAINAGYSSTARLGIYSITLELIKEEPVFGHGIGSFVRVWQLKKPAFYAEHPDATLPKQRVSHPHNETIFWLVEGGILAGIGLILVLIGVLKSLKQLPHSRRYAYAALLIPIALHTQVELPFYISASHWFLFLLLLFIVMQPGRQLFRVGLSLAANQLVKYVSLITAMLSMLFIGHSMAASIEFKNYMLEKTKDSEQPFAIAMQNPYFRPFATQTMMTLLYAKSLRYGIRSNIELFADWVTVELKRNPHIAYYQLAVNAYQAQGNNKKACAVTKEAQAIYPRDETLNRTLVKCVEQQG